MLKAYLTILLCIICTDKCFGEMSVPATFKKGSEAPSSKIHFPKELPEGEHIYLCSGYTSSQGGLYAIGCEFNSPLKKENKLAIRAIQKGLKRVRLTPASIGQKRRSVWFNFTVVFERKGGVKNIYAYENHLLDASKYGREYTAPQRVLVPTASTCAKYIKLSVMISDESESNSSNIVSSRIKEPSSCQKRLLTLMLDSTYIPATHSGKNVRAQYQEIFSTG